MLLAVWLFRQATAAARFDQPDDDRRALPQRTVVLALGRRAWRTCRGLGEVARNLGWLVVVLNLFARDNRDETVAPVRPVLAALALVELFRLPSTSSSRGSGRSRPLRR
jgi:hypothetical protein